MAAAPTFTYKAVDGAGLPSEGTITGASQSAAMEELKTRGLQVMRLDEKKSGMNIELRLMPKRVKAAELTIMTRQLATMVSSGMTLLRAFYVLEDQVENDKFKEVLGKVREDIESGLNFSDALDKHPKVFGPLYVAMIRAGEAGGVLEQSLDRTADQLEKDDDLRRQVKGAMAYPAVVLTFALGTLLALIAFIVPVFVGIFKDFGGKLPLITQFTVNLSNLVTGQWYILITSRSAASSASASGRSPAGAARSGTSSACACRSTSARRCRRSRSRAGRARSRRSTPPACRSCRRSR